MSRQALRTFHPLANCHWRTFVQLYCRHWPYSVRSLPARALSSACVLLQMPGNAFEQRFYARRIAEHQFPEPPTFIVGHWRSGTTYIHNVLTRSNRFATINLAQAVRPLGAMRFPGAFQKILKQVIPPQRQIDGIAFSPTEPQEEELALALMGDLSAYHNSFFPRDALRNSNRVLYLQDLEAGEIERFAANYLLIARKVSLLDGGTRPLLFKNPANTARLDFLRKTFPGARFIHVVRHPSDVVRSTIQMLGVLTEWLSFHKLPEGAAIDEAIDAIIANYESLMRAHLEQRSRIDPDHYIEVRYEDFKTDPLGAVDRINEAFGWGMDDSARESIRRYLVTIAEFKPNQRPDDPELLAKIASRLKFAYEQWDYEV